MEGIFNPTVFAPPSVFAQREFTADEIGQLKQLIAKERLLASSSTERPTDGTGRYLIFIMNLRVGQKQSAIKVSGMTSRIQRDIKRHYAKVQSPDRRDLQNPTCRWSVYVFEDLPKPHAR